MTIRFVNPRPQFFDSAGDPLVKGRMFFFESGTAVNKPVFADVNETIPAPVDGDGAVPLAADGRVPEIFYSGTARVLLQNKPIEPNFIQVWDIDGVGAFGSGAAFDTWNSIVEYEKGAYVVGSDGLNYKSLQNNNSNNDPVSSPTFWEQVNFIRIWNPNITYALGDGGVLGSDGKQYRSLQAANLNNDPVSSPTFWGVDNPFSKPPTAPVGKVDPEPPTKGNPPTWMFPAIPASFAEISTRHSTVTFLPTFVYLPA